MRYRLSVLVRIGLFFVLGLPVKLFAQDDPLPSWADGQPKQRIIEFVSQVSNPSHPRFVPVPERLAVFDHDGTLWSEQPIYFQLAFAMDQVIDLAKQDYSLKGRLPYAAILENDQRAIAGFGMLDWARVLRKTHTGMTREDFRSRVSDWIATAKHPQTGMLYKEMVYQPMLELLHYLEKNGFRNYIVSGGEVDFMRPWVQSVYGIPPFQVVGSTIKTEVTVSHDGQVRLIRESSIIALNEGKEKVASIDQSTGQRPIFAVGNSDGDYEMLLWTSTNPKGGLSLIVHHTDDVREYRYDRGSPVGKLEKGLDDATKYHWQLIDMKTDWKQIFSRQ